MQDLSIAIVEQPAGANRGRRRQLITALSDLMRRISARRCLLAELDRLPEEALRDIGLLQADVTSLRKIPMFADSFGQLAVRFQERHAAGDKAQI